MFSIVEKGVAGTSSIVGEMAGTSSIVGAGASCMVECSCDSPVSGRSESARMELRVLLQVIASTATIVVGFTLKMSFR